MSKREKLLFKLLSGSADQNFEFSDLLKILFDKGFECRIKGSHHIFFKEGVDEIVNLQIKGNLAKPYQVKQVRELLIKYNLIANG
jgi:hypothetical protein